MSDIRLYMLQSGTLKCKVHNIKMNQGDGAPYEIPVPFFLITHPQGHTIIDGGNAVEVATDARGHWGGICDVYWPEDFARQHEVVRVDDPAALLPLEAALKVIAA